MSEALVLFLDFDCSMNRMDLELPTPTAVRGRVKVVRNALKSFYYLQGFHHLAERLPQQGTSTQQAAAPGVQLQYSVFAAFDDLLELQPLSPLFDPSVQATAELVAPLGALDNFFPHRSNFTSNQTTKPIPLGAVATQLRNVRRLQIKGLPQLQHQQQLFHSGEARFARNHPDPFGKVKTRGILIASRNSGGSNSTPPGSSLRPELDFAPADQATTELRSIHLDVLALGAPKKGWEKSPEWEQLALDLHQLCERKLLTSFSVIPCEIGLDVGNALAQLHSDVPHRALYSHGLLLPRTPRSPPPPLPPVLPSLGERSPYMLEYPTAKSFTPPPPPPPPPPAPTPPQAQAVTTQPAVVVVPPTGEGARPPQTSSGQVGKQLPQQPRVPSPSQAALPLQAQGRKPSMDDIFGSAQTAKTSPSQGPAPPPPTQPAATTGISDTVIARNIVHGQADNYPVYIAQTLPTIHQPQTQPQPQPQQHYQYQQQPQVAAPRDTGIRVDPVPAWTANYPGAAGGVQQGRVTASGAKPSTNQAPTKPPQKLLNQLQGSAKDDALLRIVSFYSEFSPNDIEKAEGLFRYAMTEDDLMRMLREKYCPVPAATPVAAAPIVPSTTVAPSAERKPDSPRAVTQVARVNSAPDEESVDQRLAGSSSSGSLQSPPSNPTGTTSSPSPGNNPLTSSPSREGREVERAQSTQLEAQQLAPVMKVTLRVAGDQPTSTGAASSAPTTVVGIPRAAESTDVSPRSDVGAALRSRQNTEEALVEQRTLTSASTVTPDDLVVEPPVATMPGEVNSAAPVAPATLHDDVTGYGKI
jgi:hypothetical protein